MKGGMIKLRYQLGKSPKRIAFSLFHKGGKHASSAQPQRDSSTTESSVPRLRDLKDLKGGKHSNGAIFGRIRGIAAAIRNYFVSVNWFLALMGILASVYGVIMIKSTGVVSLTVQISAIILGVVAYLMIAMFDISHLAVFWKIAMAGGVLLLLSVLVIGRTAGGNAGWISIQLGSADLSFQPGEVVKIVMIITLAKHLELLGEKITTFKGVAQIAMHFMIYVVALVFSKDDGMLLTYGILFVAMVFAAGIQLRYLLFGGAVLVAATPFIWQYLLDYYQKMRILVVLDPTLDLEGKGYHAYISKIAIANGGLTGMGYGAGEVTQTSNPGNLPAKHTDFIFSVICEEMGIIGAALAIGILAAIIIACFSVAVKVRHSRFSYFLAIGVAVMLTFQMVLNVGMCIGVVPVIGLTLPFFSSGGSSVLTMFISIGMVASVGAHVRPRTLSDIF